ncbi:MAG: SDR family NAD(P)-dependent oxidoreductase, partial [Chloroflexota bacterium]|nr:SDR family NAD(P)-dependent oxidoreductase [Chloroflexota bacterium]
MERKIDQDQGAEGSTGQLTNRRVVITGGSSGIGLATARAVVRAGGGVVIVGRSVERIAQARGEIATPEAGVEGYPVDVADEGAVKAFFERVGAFDHLVLSSGVTAAGPFLELDTGAAREHFEGKFWGYYYA